MSYFDDLGSTEPSSLSEEGIRLLREVRVLFGANLEDRKPDLRRHIVFLRLLGRFPGPDTWMILSIILSGEKKTRRIAIIRKVLAVGRISHKDSESLTGEISLPETSICSRFGMAESQPLYRKIYAAYYHPISTGRDRIALSRWVGAFSKQQPRAASNHKPSAGVIIYADAATNTMRMEIIVAPRSNFPTSQRIAH